MNKIETKYKIGDEVYFLRELPGAFSCNINLEKRKVDKIEISVLSRIRIIYCFIEISDYKFKVEEENVSDNPKDLFQRILQKNKNIRTKLK